MALIVDVDEALDALLRRDVLNGAQVDIAFDAPTRDWAAKRSGPALNVFLHDIREDPRRRAVGEVAVHDETGRIVGRRRPPRVFTLGYLVTAWTQRPEDEHRLLSAVLSALLGFDAIPPELLPAGLASTGMPCTLGIGRPPADRSAADLWPALGGELRPSLDLVVGAPALPGVVDVAPLVLEPAVVSLRQRSL